MTTFCHFINRIQNTRMFISSHSNIKAFITIGDSHCETWPTLKTWQVNCQNQRIPVTSLRIFHTSKRPLLTLLQDILRPLDTVTLYEYIFFCFVSSCFIFSLRSFEHFFTFCRDGNYILHVNMRVGVEYGVGIRNNYRVKLLKNTVD